jgi:TonB-dependent starch-binding outer membrane protein SusC
VNGAEITNKGVEVSVGADIITGKNFSWSVNANATFVKNNFSYPPAGTAPVALTGALHGQGASGAYAEVIAHDQPLNVFFLRRFNGFDQNGIAVYATSAPEYAGDPNPSTYVGFSTELGYKKFSFTIGMHGSFGNKLFNNTAMSVLNISNINNGKNIAAGLVNGAESTANPITASTRFLESGNYMKVNNLTLRYTFGDVKFIRNLSVYASANNVFVITKYKGFDPEVNTDKTLNGIPSVGIDYIGYPSQRTFLFGLNFSL